MYGEGGEQNRDAKGRDAAFAGWHEIISYIPDFWENIVTSGKRDKTKLIASRSHSLAPRSSACSWQQRALPSAGDKEETLKPSAAQMCKCNYTKRAGLEHPARTLPVLWKRAAFQPEPKLLWSMRCCRTTHSCFCSTGSLYGLSNPGHFLPVGAKQSQGAVVSWHRPF